MYRACALVLVTACGRVGFDVDRGPCNYDAQQGAPFATADAPYLICTPDQLDQIGQHPELWGAAFELGADLDVTDRDPVPYIGHDPMGFTGTFDGGNHTITGLHHDDASADQDVALFSFVDGTAQIANLTLADVNMRGNGDYVASLVGYGIATRIENIAIEGATLVGPRSVGGLIGGVECYNTMGVVCPDMVVQHVTVTDANLSSTGTFFGAGGVFGYAGTETMQITFDDLHSSGSVSGGAEVGGLGGDVEGVLLENSDSAMAVTCGQRCGGLTGDLTYGNTVITRSHASGDVTCTGAEGLCGGAISETDGAGVSNVSASGNVTCMAGGCGGAFGDIAGDIVECYATGTVTGTGEGVGGLVGYAESGVRDSYATGDVIITGNLVGGLAGQVGSKGIARSYATGRVQATGEYVGALVGGTASLGAVTIADSFASGSVQGASPGNHVGPVSGGAKQGTYVSSGNVTSAACANTSGACTPDPGAKVAPAPDYFSTVTNAPMSAWDLGAVWQAVPGAPPKLRNTP